MAAKNNTEESGALSYPLRLPNSLREALEKARAGTERSLNAEILFRLRRDLANDGKPPVRAPDQVPPAYKSDKLDMHLMEVVKALPADKQLALLQLLR